MKPATPLLVALAALAVALPPRPTGAVAPPSFRAITVPGLRRDLADGTNLSPFETCLVGNGTTLSRDTNYFTPTSPLWADYATGANSRIDRRPAAVFFAESETDVVKAVRCAVQNGLAPVPRGGGHSYEVLSSMDDAVVIDLASMDAVSLVNTIPGTDNAIFRIQGGARLGHVYKELFRQGEYNFNAGTCPGVGIGGHVSGGGYGMTSRKYGMAADTTVGLRVVLANGRVVEATENSEPELFWALRGGGAGSFGIVTEFRIRAHKVPKSTMFTIYYDETVTKRLLRSWMDYFPTADDRITTQVNVDKRGTIFRGQFLGPMWELDNLLLASGMLSHGGIKYDVRTDRCTALGTKAFMWGDDCNNLGVLNTEKHPGRNSKGYGKLKSGYASKKLSDEGIQTVIDQLNGVQNDAWIQFEAYGGVFATKPVSYTPWGGRDAVFSVQLYVNAQKGESSDSPGRQWIRRFAEALRPHLNGRAYQNYCDLEIGPNYGEAYWGKENFERLKQIKKKYDPTNQFRSAQSVPLP